VDWKVVVERDGSRTVWVRAELERRRESRVYHIAAWVRDGSGNIATAAAHLTVLGWFYWWWGAPDADGDDAP
jgi:hypothetical protein